MADWLLLHYALAAKPSARRVYIWRKLRALGAVLLPNAIWVLPDTERAAEHFRWLATEIQEMGGEACLWRSNLLLGMPEDSLIQQFVDQVDGEYGGLLKRLDQKNADLAEISRQYQQIAKGDYFQSGAGRKVRERLIHAERQGKMNWVTWENIGVDRMGCIWLIQRWIDPKARFTFIPAGSKPLPKEAEPFDIPGTRFSHHRGHCSFHALLKEYQIKDAVLAHIASIIDEADVVQEINLEAAAPGLDLVCRGVRLTSADDRVAMERGKMVYEALYAQLGAELASEEERSSAKTQGILADIRKEIKHDGHCF